jgi:hypothetical protein
LLDWLFLLVCLALGGFILCRPDRFAFRGSTLLGFLCLSLGMTSPLAHHPTRMMLASGAGPDAFIGTWNLWWTRTALSMGVNPFATDWLFYPHGTSLALHTYSFTYGLLTLPLQWLVGAVLGNSAGANLGPAERMTALFVVYNLIVIASFTLTGYFTYRLADQECGVRGAALLAGIILAYANYHFANTVRLHALSLEFLVLAAWAWTRWIRRPTPWRFFLWAMALVLLFYASLEYAAYSVLLFAVLAAPMLSRLKAGAPAGPGGGRIRPTPPFMRQVLLHAAAGGGAATCALPLLVQLARRLAEGSTRFDPRLTTLFSADLFDFFLPNPRHPLWGRLFAPITARFHNGDGGFGLSLGWVVLGLLVLSAASVFRVRSGRRWFWGLIVFWVLSLGPSLHLGGHVLGAVPLPQAWLSKLLPFLTGSRTPIRYMAPGGLCLALTIACGWAARMGHSNAAAGTRGHAANAGARNDVSGGRGDTSCARIASTLRPTSLEIVLGAVVLFETLSAPMPVTAVPLPDVYNHISAAPGSSTLVHIPSMTAREDLLYQTVHRQKLVESVESAMPLRSRRGEDLFAQPQWTALTRGLGRSGWIGSLPEEERANVLRTLRSLLANYNVRFVVLVRSRWTPAADGRGFVQTPVLDEPSYRAFSEHLRLLGPSGEQEFGGETLFQFAADSPAR